MSEGLDSRGVEAEAALERADDPHGHRTAGPVGSGQRKHALGGRPAGVSIQFDYRFCEWYNDSARSVLKRKRGKGGRRTTLQGSSCSVVVLERSLWIQIVERN
jgi:hypothetical protein